METVSAEQVLFEHWKKWCETTFKDEKYMTIEWFRENTSYDGHILAMEEYAKLKVDEYKKSIKDKTEPLFGYDLYKAKWNTSLWNPLTDEQKRERLKTIVPLPIEMYEEYEKTLKDNQPVNNKQLLFALNNVKSYLESFRKEWKEGEELLWYEVEAAISNTEQPVISDEEIYQWAIKKAQGFEKEQLARQCFYEGAIWMRERSVNTTIKKGSYKS